MVNALRMQVATKTLKLGCEQNRKRPIYLLGRIPPSTGGSTHRGMSVAISSSSDPRTVFH